ncbi:hypothetical protein ACIPWE_35945 [Streptomyces sp. NPDC090073]|uniref:hypothetical protein n=1 Tax=Streptomyces sp. NPDC090073 TaxID=3365936 RepID=UPI003826747C
MAICAVLLTPRLLGPSGQRLTVGDFGLQSWPERLALLGFKALRATQPLPAAPLRVPHTTLDGQQIQFTPADQQKAWQALFPPSTPVKPYRSQSYQDRSCVEFPASEAASEIRTVYTATARARLAFDETTPQADAGLRHALRQITQQWQTGLRTPADRPAIEQTALERAYAFYHRDGSTFTPLTREPAEVEKAEFHDTVARLADHPFLLRALGLLIDVAVPASALAGAAPAAELSVVPQWPANDSNPPAHWRDAEHKDLAPKTAYTITGKRFLATPGTGPASTPFAQGLLPLAGTSVAPSGNARFELMPFDVDGAALRLVAAAGADSGGDFSEAAPPGALPALRTAGIALVERDRRQQHEKQLQRAARRATPEGLLSAPLTADSLLGGYRVEVWDETAGQWFSLCRRRVSYTIGGVPVGRGTSDEGSHLLLDEGWVRPGPVATGAGATDALYLHQTVVRWNDWSLVAERPDRVVDTGDAALITSLPAPFKAVVECDPGSLPRLRFGRGYRLRVRIADLAGGGLRTDEAGPGEQRTERVIYHRYEPLPPPEILPTRAFAPGEGQDRLVIRSDRGISVADYAAAHGYRALDIRHLLAPKCSLELAIRHDGLFDPAMGPDARASEVDRLFAIAKLTDRDLLNIPGAQVIGAEGGAEPPYVVLPEAVPGLPWAADPAADHVVLNTHPRPIDPDTGNPGSVDGENLPVFAEWQDPWPARRPISLRLLPAAAGCTIGKSADERTFTVALGPAQQVTIDVPSCPQDHDVRLFGIARWMGIDPENKEDPGFQQIIGGKNRLITPPRTITLVHAVQRPLSDPKGRLTAQRQPGSTNALLRTGDLKIDIPSTGRIDISAEWSDRGDVPPDQPATRHAAHVGSYTVEHAIPSEAIPPVRQEFGDTRHHRVTYSVTAVSRFQDCFPRPEECLASGTLPQPTDVPSTVRPPVPKLLYTIPTFRWTESTDGPSVVRWRQGGGLRVFLDPPWFDTGDEEALAVLTWPTPQVPPPSLRQLSLAGRDPIRQTGAPPGVLGENHLVAPLRTRVPLPELGRTVGVAAYPIRFDDQSDRRYADIDLSPVVATSYFPFVELALVRHQPYTAAGVASLSPVVRTEPVQLPPHRRLVVTRAGGHAAVLVEGLGPGDSAPNAVKTELQILDSAGSTGWATLFRATSRLGQQHVLDIPTGMPGKTRVVVQEFETQPSTASSSSTTADGTGRLVYADIVPLAGG